jgi:diketogulonate reductase-like aldo/keto reductase
VFAIPMTSKAAHAKENAAGGDVELSDQDVERLDQAFPLGAPRPGVPTL